MNKPQPREFWPPKSRATSTERPSAPPERARRLIRLTPIGLVALAMLGGVIGSVVTLAVYGGFFSGSPPPQSRGASDSDSQAPGVPSAEAKVVETETGGRHPSLLSRVPPNRDANRTAPVVVVPDQAPQAGESERTAEPSTQTAALTVAATASTGGTTAGVVADGLVVVSLLSGRASVRSASDSSRKEWRGLQEGDVLHQGDEVSSSNNWRDPGKIELRINGASFVRLSSRYEIKIPKASSSGAAGRRTMQVEIGVEGLVWVNDKHGSDTGTSLTLRSNPLEARGNGARFLLDNVSDPFHGVTQLKVYEGMVPASLLDGSHAETISEGQLWETRVIGPWAHPKRFRSSSFADDEWVSWNMKRDNASWPSVP